ncbi:PDZ and LIM domain protein 7 isoform X2 [Lingula anatina]|uniref:PDZ and LIM domain protein 7 isoform X2 n=1 Tax=Lingula anatina TaxID=7574 RepID=A0A1S3I2K0_LINAN|nr:PDZ and LIM domain protein 7 isoform X2 [Lingula anatina]|eukprot:XP_013392473.1 PDZ and LIM domain protein 7 isoform X2 [Lingula anatina]
MTQGDVYKVQLRRHLNQTQWGFQLAGGANYNMPFFIKKVTPNSIAAKHGMAAGDAVLRIGNTIANGLSHNQAKMEVIRAGNELDFILQKGAIDLTNPAYQCGAGDTVDDSGAQFEGTLRHTEGPVSGHPGHAASNVQSRSFRILQMQLSEEEHAAQAQQPAK